MKRQLCFFPKKIPEGLHKIPSSGAQWDWRLTPPLQAASVRQDDERKIFMDNRGKRQASSIFGGMGFYIALLVCVVAAGVVGYFALLKDDPEPQTDPIPSAVTDPEPAISVTRTDPEPAAPVISDVPIPVEKPTVLPVSAPEKSTAEAEVLYNEDDAPVEEPAPIVAAEPMIIVSPISGETAAAFSVDQLVYDATMGDWRTHDGIDIQAEAGTAVASASAGIVLSVEDDGRMGTTIRVDHRNGYITTYASLQPEVSVLAGDEIPAGAVLGAVGNTSLTEAGLGAHLHFGVEKDGALIDPAEFLAE